MDDDKQDGQLHEATTTPDVSPGGRFDNVRCFRLRNADDTRQQLRRFSLAELTLVATLVAQHDVD